MILSSSNSRRLRNLFLLADLCSDTDLINLKLVGYYESLREEFGLCKLLLLIQQHVKNETNQDKVAAPQEGSSGPSKETINREISQVFGKGS